MTPTAFYRSRLLWPVISLLILIPACLHPLRSNHEALRVSDFCSHGLYLSFIGLSVFLLLWSVRRGQPMRVLWWPLLVSLSSFLCVEGLKLATRLPRPNGRPDGFPSGHTTYSYALAWLLTQTCPRLAPLWYGIAIGIGWSRVEGHAHYPYQVFCGAIFGTAIGWGISRYVSRRVTA